ITGIPLAGPATRLAARAVVEKRIARTPLIGSAADIRDRLRPYVDAGATGIIVSLRPRLETPRRRCGRPDSRRRNSPPHSPGRAPQTVGTDAGRASVQLGLGPSPSLHPSVAQRHRGGVPIEAARRRWVVSAPTADFQSRAFHREALPPSANRRRPAPAGWPAPRAPQAKARRRSYT